MKILITGSSGYLGQHFLDALIKRVKSDYPSHQIYAIYGSMERFKDNVISSIGDENDNNIHLDKVDIKNKDSIQSYIQLNGPFDICFHLAAISSPKLCQQNSKLAKDINVPIHLFNVLKHHTTIIALSTDQVYCGTKAPYFEECNVGPVNVYAESKVGMEKLLMGDNDDDDDNNNNERTKPVVCLRSSIILGPMAPFGGAHSTFLHFCHSRQGIETTFYTDEIRSVISVRDVVQILIYFFDKVINKKSKSLLGGCDTDEETFIISGIYNMGGPDRVSRMDMAVAVAKECGFSHEFTFLPAEKSKLELGHNDVPSPLDISMDSSKLEQIVGWKFSGLEATVKETFATFKSL